MNSSDNRNGRPQRPNSPQNGNRQQPRSTNGRPMSDASQNRPRSTNGRPGTPPNRPQSTSGRPSSSPNRPQNPQRRPGTTSATGAQRPNNSGIQPMKPKKGLFSKKNKTKRQPQNAQKPNTQQQKPNTQQRPQRSQQPNAKPVINKRASKAAAKAMNTKHAVQTRSKFRGGSYILYYLLIAIVLIVVLIILANTVLFNCKQIVVDGVQRYTADEIIDVSGIRKGDNLLHLDTDKAAEKVESELAYVESAKVERSFPTKIVITVAEAEKWFCINQFGVKAVISRGGKILEKGSSQGLIEVTGYEAESLETGVRLTSKVEGKKTIPEQILNAADKAGVTDIVTIDMTDRYAISVVVDGRINLELGGITDIETKMLVAHELIEKEIAPHENVTVLLTNPEKVAVHTNQPENNQDNQPDTSTPGSSEPADTSNNPENSASSE